MLYMLDSFESYRWELMGKLADICNDVGDEDTANGWKWLAKYKRWPRLMDCVNEYSWFFNKIWDGNCRERREELPVELVGGFPTYSGYRFLEQWERQFRINNPRVDMTIAEYNRFMIDNRPKPKRGDKRYMVIRGNSRALRDVMNGAAVGVGKALADGLFQTYPEKTT